MSLEEALKANTAAVERHTAMLEKMLAGATGGKTTSAKTETKAETKAEEPKSSKPSGGKTTTTKRKGEITVEAVADRVKTFLKTGDEDTRAERKEQVRRIVEHYGVERFTAIDPAKFEEALDYLAQFEKGDDPFGDGDEDEDGDGDDAMV